MKHESLARRGFRATTLVLALGLAAGATLAAEAVNPDADEILRAMSKFMGGT